MPTNTGDRGCRISFCARHSPSLRVGMHPSQLPCIFPWARQAISATPKQPSTLTVSRMQRVTATTRKFCSTQNGPTVRRTLSLFTAGQAWAARPAAIYSQSYTCGNARWCSHQPTRDLIVLTRVALETAQNLDENNPGRHGLLAALNDAFTTLDTAIRWIAMRFMKVSSPL